MFHKSNGRQNFSPLVEADGGVSLIAELCKSNRSLYKTEGKEPELPDAEIVLAMLRREKVGPLWLFMIDQLFFNNATAR